MSLLHFIHICLLSNAYYHADLHTRFQFSSCLSRVDHIDKKTNPVSSKRLVDPIASVICFIFIHRKIVTSLQFKTVIVSLETAYYKLQTTSVYFLML